MLCQKKHKKNQNSKIFKKETEKSTNSTVLSKRNGMTIKTLISFKYLLFGIYKPFNMH